MKKFLSMVMAAAMVVSLVPATAFAASGDFKATAKVVDAQNYTETEIKDANGLVSDAEIQLTFTTADITKGGSELTFEFTLDNAKIADTNKNNQADGVTAELRLDGEDQPVELVPKYVDEDEFEVTISADDSKKIKRGDVLAIGVSTGANGIVMDKMTKGKTAVVSVDSDDATVTNGDDLVIASVESKGIKASVKDTVDIATEEVATLEEIKVEPSVGADFDAIIADPAKAELTLKLPSGYEFTARTDVTINDDNTIDFTNDDDEITIKVSELDTTASVWKIKGLEVEAVSAKAGATGKVKVGLTGSDSVSVEAIKVVDYTVAMSVDEDEDVPVIYSGVNVDNDGITDDSDHQSLEVTIEESFAGAWNNSKDFTLSVPEGVYVVDVVDPTAENMGQVEGDEADWFATAYNEGDYVDLTFERRTWDETDPSDEDNDDPIELTFTLVLVADPNFEGDVVLKLTGDAVDEQEVTIAKFVKPFTVEAQQNDMQIDYRNTEIPTSVVIKEAEAGLWDKGTKFELSLDKIEFDDEGSIAVDDKSGLEIKDNEIKEDKGILSFTIDSRSDDEPAVVTLSGMQLYMQRSLPAGAYDLKVWSPSMLSVAADKDTTDDERDGYLNEKVLGMELSKESDKVYGIADINDDFYSDTAKAGFVNIVTAGREDTESFTTKVVVPVGESYLISGENKVTIDVPAYINANGYTMLPLRAVAVALGINSNNVLWDQSTRTATIMYGSKIINMTYGQKVVYVNGAMIPATAAVEITNDRMFLGLRDLGNALGVTDITWDAATKTATLNGNK